MRILLLNYEYPPLGGGAAQATECMVRAFMALDPDLELDIVAASPGAFREERLSRNIRLFRLDVGKKGEAHYQHAMELVRYTLKARAKAGTLMRERPYDLVHAFFAAPTGMVAYSLRKESPYIISLRGSDVPYYNERFKRLYPVLKPLLKPVVRNARAVISNSEGLKALANVSFPNLAIRVIPNGVDTAYFSPPPVRPGPPLNILFTGRLIQRKGVEFLMEAFAGLRRRIEAVLAIAGSGNLEEALRKKAETLNISGSIRFLGNIKGEVLLAAYHAAHVFVLPSLNEGMSNALLEAMACGLPVIVTDTGGTRELLNANGIVVEKKSAADLEAALLKLGASPSLREAMGKQSRRIAETMSWDSTARQYLGLYREIPDRKD
jgi:L-malate glycosyltransferase